MRIFCPNLFTPRLPNRHINRSANFARTSGNQPGGRLVCTWSGVVAMHNVRNFRAQLIAAILLVSALLAATLPAQDKKPDTNGSPTGRAIAASAERSEEARSSQADGGNLEAARSGGTGKRDGRAEESPGR